MTCHTVPTVQHNVAVVVWSKLKASLTISRHTMVCDRRHWQDAACAYGAAQEC
jgi:hypothetical protein